MQKRPPQIVRRYDFANYAATRGFLDELAALSERTGRYPDLNFARTHVHVNLAMDGEEPGTVERDFTAAADSIAQRHAG